MVLNLQVFLLFLCKLCNYGVHNVIVIRALASYSQYFKSKIVMFLIKNSVLFVGVSLSFNNVEFGEIAQIEIERCFCEITSSAFCSCHFMYLR
jgi:hypothetical protein